jgi:hypothetical protein
LSYSSWSLPILIVCQTQSWQIDAVRWEETITSG